MIPVMNITAWGQRGSVGRAAADRARPDHQHRHRSRRFHYDASFALGHPQKFIDFGYRSIHLMTVRGKQIANAFYDASRSIRTSMAAPRAGDRR
jgi:hypothetical protein